MVVDHAQPAQSVRRTFDLLGHGMVDFRRHLRQLIDGKGLRSADTDI
jgi:hypothetical protein